MMRQTNNRINSCFSLFSLWLLYVSTIWTVTTSFVVVVQYHHHQQQSQIRRERSNKFSLLVGTTTTTTSNRNNNESSSRDNVIDTSSLSSSNDAGSSNIIRLVNGNTSDFTTSLQQQYDEPQQFRTDIKNGYTETGGYNSMLDGKRIRKKDIVSRWWNGINTSNTKMSDKEVNEDGWQEMRNQKLPLWRKVLRIPLFKHSFRAIFPKPPVEVGTLIFVRHGESLWNANKTFTGWADPDLSERGYREVEHAARLILECGYEIDVVFTSRLKRAIRSAWIILQEMNQVYLPVFKSWRLNERMYGALTGLCKSDTAQQLGAELVQEWRGSLKSRPPALQPKDIYWPGRDRKYADLSYEEIPLTESLSDCMERCLPVWEQKIMFELRNGKNVLVVAHANTLRGLIKVIDNVSDDDIRDVAIPTGIPIVYKFDKDMKSIPPSGGIQTASQIHMKGMFLEKPGLLKEALKQEEIWKTQIPGYNATLSRSKSPMTSLERSLFKLRAERELGAWAGQFIDPNAPVEDDGSDGNMGRPIQLVEDMIWEQGLNDLSSGEQFDPDSAIFNEDSIEHRRDFDDNSLDEDSKPFVNLISSNQPCIKSIPSESIIPDLGPVPIRQDAVIVIIRHGKTEHNKLGLFTGWEDAPLAKEGVDEARAAGRLLKLHGFEFDVVYTSWLSRAIETAWHVIDELDSLWLPIIKSWRLNERMYGKLTGLSKQMVKQRHGEAQFKAWRRGYRTAPPKVSSFSQHYPGNDPRYQKYLTDLRFSLRESIIRSIESGALTPARKLPKSESLKDCMDRTIPFFKERIVPEAINKGKRVLISSSENAIRGLLIHLCDIPEDVATELEIPNGLPIIFDIKSKCVKLLDDGSGIDPLEKHNFGKAANYLFKPCQNENGSPDEECTVIFNDNVQITDADRATIDAIKRQPATMAR